MDTPQPVASPRTSRTPRKPPTRPYKSKKLNPERVKALRAKGMSVKQIGKIEGLAHTTVWRFLERTSAQRQALERYKANRADELAFLHGETLEVQHMVIKSILRDLEEDGVSRTLTPNAKASYLGVLNAAQGTTFDKERLERGQSTQNHSLVHKMMGSAFDSAHKDALPEPKTEDSEPKV